MLAISIVVNGIFPSISADKINKNAIRYFARLDSKFREARSDSRFSLFAFLVNRLIITNVSMYVEVTSRNHQAYS